MQRNSLFNNILNAISVDSYANYRIYKFGNNIGVISDRKSIL